MMLALAYKAKLIKGATRLAEFLWTALIPRVETADWDSEPHVWILNYVFIHCKNYTQKLASLNYECTSVDLKWHVYPDKVRSEAKSSSTKL